MKVYANSIWKYLMLVMNKGSIQPFRVQWGFQGYATPEVIKLILLEVVTRNLSEGIGASIES